MMYERGSFNDYLTTVDRLRRKGVERPEAHWRALKMLWPEKATQVQSTSQDPRQLNGSDLDSWMGTLVSVWNRKGIT